MNWTRRRSPPTALARAGERGLSDAGHVLDEEVSFRQESDERELDGLVLALERRLHRLTQSLERGELLGDARRGGRHGVAGVSKVQAGSRGYGAVRRTA